MLWFHPSQVLQYANNCSGSDSCKSRRMNGRGDNSDGLTPKVGTHVDYKAEVVRLQEEVESWKQIAQGYENYIKKLLREYELLETFVGPEKAVELELAAAAADELDELEEVAV